MPDEFAAVRATAQAMNCTCYGKCSQAAALQCLYRRTLDIVSRENGPVQLSLELVKPLGVVLGYQKTYAGQRDCAAFAETLAAGDPAGSLAACHRMMDRAGVPHLGA